MYEIFISSRSVLNGNKIVISRTVTISGGGGYKLKNADGKVVIERRAKEELDNILSAFGIQVSNPIALLNQDAAKSFLMKCDSDKLYEFFMKATQLEDCKNEYNRAAEEARVAASLLSEKEKNLLLLKAEAKRWEKKFRVSEIRVFFHFQYCPYFHFKIGQLAIKFVQFFCNYLY